MQPIIYNLEIQLLSPLSILSGEGQSGFARNIIRDINNKPIIPGSTIKGIVKSNYIYISGLSHKHFECSCEACQIFGAGGNRSSLIFFEDLKPADENYQFSYRIGTAIDRKRRVVLHNALYAQETVESVKFCGHVLLYLNSSLASLGAKEKLELAIKMIDRVGSGKSRGLGYVRVKLQGGQV